jgi:hypothetical protein
MAPQTNFEQLGFFKEYYTPEGKFIGHAPAEKDRETFGYMGRKKEVLAATVVFRNKKQIKAGTEVVTQLQVTCGKMLTTV